LTIYGAGDVGRSMLAACRASGIAVVRIVDGDSALWEQAIDGVRVMPVDACATDRLPVVVLASFVHGAAMRKNLRAALGPKKARIFAPARWVI
jgi:FlaA1/EpsC-like NDP-sugar epimerase